MAEIIDIDKQLLPDEKNLLDQYESVIQRGLETFYAVGEALNAIKVGKLYRAEYGTFEDYCAIRWKMTGRHANQTVAAKKAVDNIEMGTVVPISILSMNAKSAHLPRLNWINRSPHGSRPSR